MKIEKKTYDESKQVSGQHIDMYERPYIQEEGLKGIKNIKPDRHPSWP